MEQATRWTANALAVLEKRYLWRDSEGRITESPEGLFERVAGAIAEPEGRQGARWAERFLEMMLSRRFMPNTPTLMNAGKEHGQLSACFVIPVRDSLEGIFGALQHAAKIHQSGGGTGFSFSELRPAGSLVKSTHGVASGPVSFIRIFDVSTETIKQGGARRGANMAVLRVDHPDIFEFVDSKRDMRSIVNFNISVGTTDEFMEAVLAKGRFVLRDPRTHQEVRSVSAQELFERITQAAWECGDPGLVFLDRVNRFNPTPQVGPMESTNPCVTGDTRIWVEGQGLIPIRELIGWAPAVATEERGISAFKKITRVICTGVKPVFRLKTAEGYELRLTADHRVMTARGDVPAEKLETGDQLRLACVEAGSAPREGFDARLGELIGWLASDGHFTNHEAGKQTVVLSFYGADKCEAASRLAESVRQLLGDEEISLCAVESRDLNYIRSQRLRNHLADFEIDEECKKRVPEAVWRGPPALVSGYLRGLFSADGSVQGTLAKGKSVRLSSNQLELLSGTQLLLLSLGIKSVLYPNRRRESLRRMPDGRGGTKEYLCAANHELIVAKSSLASFSRAVGFLIKKKEAELDAALAGYTSGPYRDSFFATVSSLDLEGEEEVFDLTEPATSHFYANGILVHNCGEQPLLPYESCNLGSLNLGFYANDGTFDWELFRKDIHVAVRFLDNVIDVNTYPVKECATITHRNRKIGLGVMGFADLLLELELTYDSEAARAFGERIMSFLDREAKTASMQLARERGEFANFKGSLWHRLGYPPLRNATVSTVAPTGTISMIAGCSSGIEPIFAAVFYRNVLSGARLLDVHPAVLRKLNEKGASIEGLTEEKVGSLLGKAWSPASKVSTEGHVRMQAAFQRHSDSAVSKTINLPEAASIADVSRAYLEAYRNGCKGITIYRDRSRPSQVLDRDIGISREETVEAADCPSC